MLQRAQVGMELDDGTVIAIELEGDPRPEELGVYLLYRRMSHLSVLDLITNDVPAKVPNHLPPAIVDTAPQYVTVDSPRDFWFNHTAYNYLFFYGDWYFARDDQPAQRLRDIINLK